MPAVTQVLIFPSVFVDSLNDTYVGGSAVRLPIMAVFRNTFGGHEKNLTSITHARSYSMLNKSGEYH